jgi:hypothetical protein
MDSFSSSHFVWMDLECARDQTMLDLMQRPFSRVADLCPPNRLSLLQVQEPNEWMRSLYATRP